MELVLHPQTNKEVEAFIASPSHALMIEGMVGSGKAALSMHIAARILDLSPEKLESYSFYNHVQPVDNVITIDAVRNMQQFMRLKSIGTKSIRRVLFIEDAHRMTIEAQNALLKLLEEPPADTVIVFSAAPDQSLLPTIYSRAQHIHVKTPPKQTVVDYFSGHGYKSADIERAYYLSEGQLGLLAALLEDDKDHPLKASIETAKQLVGATAFERMAVVDRLSKQKDRIPELIYALERVYRAVLVQASDKGSTPQIKRAHAALERLMKANQSLPRNPNTKLLLTDLLLNL